MADTPAKEAKISVKVIIDKVNRRVVYAEADHAFVDILFSFMTLPMGTIVRLLGKVADKRFEALGSLNNLYQSLKDFPECYLSTEECKFLLMNPRSLSFDHCTKLKLKLDDTEPLNYFKCATCSIDSFSQAFISTCNKAKCRGCGKLMNKEVGYKKPNVCVGGRGGVFVSDIATFIVTDDLRVMPYTSASSIRLLTDFGITDHSCLDDLKLDMGCEEIFHLLKMALSLNSAFTYLVFNRIIPIRDLVVPDQSSTLDQTALMKKEEVSATTKMRLEVSLQRSTGKLLFAEAKEDFVDFLFEFLSIPLGTVVGELLKGASSVTCMDNIFKSLSNMNVGRYIKSQDIKDMLLKPHIGQLFSSKNQVFPLEVIPSSPLRAQDLKDPRIDGGRLKQSGMFIVTDDLIITPSSSYATLNTLKDLKVSFDDIERCEISIGLIECVKILKASLKSRLILTDSLEHLLKK
ncbi:hypothetical protein M8C21_032027 [Ambrosia artemisiifolia]|uniref:DUF674 family protein n=1 Tax=Ambrosia artemisiifolia TaxID=4212 RepID=A0AAD5CNW3_AMBAR|nr:hypothetical protein M8C21_032027 [Ambrosia artemisiifolia]